MLSEVRAAEGASAHGSLELAPTGAVALGGVLGQALSANHRGRLSTFIVDEMSPAIALFDPAHVCTNVAGDWYGEHAGKWLYGAARAASRTADAVLSGRVRRVADYLVGLQAADGYAGTYAPAYRFMHRQPPKTETWDGAPARRTWDVWTHSYLMLGLLEAHRYFPEPAYLDAARRIGDLCLRTLATGVDITDLGNHHGMSATVLMDPAVELYFATGDARFLDLALLVLAQAERNPRLALMSKLLAGADVSEIATGKAYQLLWNGTALAKLHRATGESRFLEAAQAMWRNVREHHLTLGGGPWGGVAHRSREVFNPAGAFSPYAYVETCSILAWLQLNRELLRITGSGAYAGEIERSAYNDLIGAQAPNGEDWCYYSFPNGRRIHTTYWRCCKSSGAMALEELPAIAYATAPRRLLVNLYGPSTAALAIAGVGAARVTQTGGYPFEGDAALQVELERPGAFAIDVRAPSWADEAHTRVNGERIEASRRNGYLSIEREWRSGDVLTVELPMRPRVHFRSHRNVQESQAPDGSSVAQEVLRFDYMALTRGPLVYATGLIDGYKIEETLRLDARSALGFIEESVARADEGRDVRLSAPGREPLTFTPYYRVGGRLDRSWRITWMQLAPETSP